MHASNERGGKIFGHAEIRATGDSGNGRRFPRSIGRSRGLTMPSLEKTKGYNHGGFGKWGSVRPVPPADRTGKVSIGLMATLPRNATVYYPPFLTVTRDEETIKESPRPGHGRHPMAKVIAERIIGGGSCSDPDSRRGLSQWLGKSIGSEKESRFLVPPFVEPHVAMQPPHRDRQYPEQWDVENGVLIGGGETDTCHHPPSASGVMRR